MNTKIWHLKKCPSQVNVSCYKDVHVENKTDMLVKKQIFAVNRVGSMCSLVVGYCIVVL